MNKLTKMIAALSLLGVLTIGATTARAGLIMSDFTRSDQPVNKQQQLCEEPQSTGKTNWGLIMSDLAGLIMSDFTGLIITDYTGLIITDSRSTVNCGIIITDGLIITDGIIITGD